MFLRSSLLISLICLTSLTGAKPALNTRALSAAQIRDANADGYPDSLELHSSSQRDAFLRWFAAIAESQYTAPNADWTLRDCSGLLRYAYTEALKPKTRSWWSRFRYFPDRTITPLELDISPILGTSPFRTRGGSLKRSDLENGTFQKDVSAGYLMRYATVPLGKDVRAARRGDLLFFIHPEAQGSPYHSMVYLGDGKVVYHTGYAPEDGGEVRLLTLETLKKHPEDTWHPVASNPHFLGFFRWKIAAG